MKLKEQISKKKTLLLAEIKRVILIEKKVFVEKMSKKIVRILG